MKPALGKDVSTVSNNKSNVYILNIPKKVDPKVIPKEYPNPFDSLRRDIEDMKRIHGEIKTILSELEELVSK